MIKNPGEKEFYYDAENAQYVPVNKNWKYWLKRVLLYSLVVSLLSVGMLVLFYTVFETDEVEAIKKQNTELADLTHYYGDQVDSMETQLRSLREKDKELYRIILNADPIADSQETKKPKTMEAPPSSKSLDDISKRLAEMNARLDEGLTRPDLLNELAHRSGVELRGVPILRPIETEIISGFGKRMNPITKTHKHHPGIDYKANIGTPVKATADGTVIAVESKGSGIGRYITLRHGFGYTTTYACLSKVSVSYGQRVQRGDAIGLSGNSGLSKGPHLHYEIRKDGKALDPIDFLSFDLSPEDFEVAKKQASQMNESMD